ncbi:MAG: hypothetical protein KC609_26435, partial [Myxococcales bacterium]|nr:hypothetical protein [Myxococcales bacterium]
MSELVDLERIEFSGARDGDVVDPDYIRNTRLQVVSQVAIRFMPANRVVYCDAGTMIVRARDRVIVETDKGTLTGTVVTPAHRALREARLNRRLVRFASDDDERNVQRHQFKQAESFQFCLQRIRARNLPMKLVSVKYLHAGNKAIFYFSAEGRID